MPYFANNPKASLITEQANQSWLITKTQYIVEVINGCIKQKFQYFNKTIQDITALMLFDDFRVACALYSFAFIPVDIPKMLT